MSLVWRKIQAIAKLLSDPILAGTLCQWFCHAMSVPKLHDRCSGRCPVDLRLPLSDFWQTCLEFQFDCRKMQLLVSNKRLV
jgi:hypothetical protein